MNPSDLDTYKANIIRIAKHHKKHCEGMECNISLYQLLKVALIAGLEFTNEEKRLFL